MFHVFFHKSAIQRHIAMCHLETKNLKVAEELLRDAIEMGAARHTANAYVALAELLHQTNYDILENQAIADF